MRKLVLVILIAVGFAGSANAQALAVKAGMNITDLSQDATISPGDRSNSSAGLMVGAQIRHALNKVLELQLEGLFTQKGNGLINKADNVEDRITINYIEVPLLARVNVLQSGENTLSIHGGPAFAFSTGGEEKNNGRTVVAPLKLKTFDMGLAIGAQVEQNKFLLGVRYTMGLSNIFADDAALYGFSVMKNRALTLFAGYGFR
jgi:hypothetical protein